MKHLSKKKSYIRILREEPTVTQLAQKFTAVYRTHIFFTIFSETCLEPDKYSPHHHSSSTLTYILTLSFNLHHHLWDFFYFRSSNPIVFPVIISHACHVSCCSQRPSFSHPTNLFQSEN
jgi:hypothetical protein